MKKIVFFSHGLSANGIETFLVNVLKKINREKNYIIKENTQVPFLIELGVMTKDGKIVSRMYDKFRQINRFLEFVEDVIEIDCSLFVPKSFAETFTMPLASISKVTSICGTPRRAGRIPSRWKTPRVLLSLANSLSP